VWFDPTGLVLVYTRRVGKGEGRERERERERGAALHGVLAPLESLSEPAELKHVIHHKLNPLGTPKTHVPKSAELKHVIQH